MRVSRNGIAVLVLIATGAFGAAPAHADQGIKVLINGEYWFCDRNPIGWSLADFKAVCSKIGPGGRGEFVEFYVDGRGKVRRKPQTPKKQEPQKLPLRGSQP